MDLNVIWKAIALFSLGWFLGDRTASRRRRMWKWMTTHRHWPQDAKDWIIVVLVVFMAMASIGFYFFNQALNEAKNNLATYTQCMTDWSQELRGSIHSSRAANRELQGEIKDVFSVVLNADPDDPNIDKEFQESLKQFITAFNNYYDPDTNVSTLPPTPKQSCGEPPT